MGIPGSFDTWVRILKAVIGGFLCVMGGGIMASDFSSASVIMGGLFVVWGIAVLLLLACTDGHRRGQSGDPA